MSGEASQRQEPSLCETAQQLAWETWNLMMMARFRQHRGADERSFTDHNMLWLEWQHPLQTTVRLYTQSEEARTGADFEWWLGDGFMYLPLLVQAKRLHDDDTYASLGYRPRGRHRQIDQLIESSVDGLPGARGGRRNYLPTYAFYNGLPAAGLPADSCCGHLADAEQRGVTLANALDVRDAYDERPHRARDRASIVRIGPRCFPWGCLFCCPAGGRWGLGSWALQRLTQLRNQKVDGPYRLVDAVELPGYVRSVLQLEGRVEPERFEDDEGAELPATSMVVVTTVERAMSGPETLAY